MYILACYLANGYYLATGTMTETTIFDSSRRAPQFLRSCLKNINLLCVHVNVYKVFHVHTNIFMIFVCLDATKSTGGVREARQKCLFVTIMTRANASMIFGGRWFVHKSTIR